MEAAIRVADAVAAVTESKAPGVLAVVAFGVLGWAPDAVVRVLAGDDVEPEAPRARDGPERVVVEVVDEKRRR